MATGLDDSLAEWGQRQPLRGAHLGPRNGQQTVPVAVRLRDPTRPGHLVGTTLTSASAIADSEPDQATAFVQPVLIKPRGTLCTARDHDETLEWAS